LKRRIKTFGTKTFRRSKTLFDAGGLPTRFAQLGRVGQKANLTAPLHLDRGHLAGCAA